MIPRLSAKAWVLVADGGRAMVYENGGDALAPKLVEVRTRELPNPPAREQGTDKPGRYHDGMSPHRSAVEATDFHKEAEKAFMADIAGELADDLAKGRFKELVVAVAPRALGHFRKATSAQLKQHIVAELAKDYTRQAPGDVEKAIMTELQGA